MKFSFTTHQCPGILSNQTISEKKTKNRFEDMELTAGGSYRMWNSGVNYKRSGIYKGDQ